MVYVLTRLSVTFYSNITVVLQYNSTAPTAAIYTQWLTRSVGAFHIICDMHYMQPIIILLIKFTAHIWKMTTALVNHPKDVNQEVHNYGFGAIKLRISTMCILIYVIYILVTTAIIALIIVLVSQYYMGTLNLFYLRTLTLRKIFP